MTSYPIAEAKAHFSELLRTVEEGNEVLVTKGQSRTPVAVVVPISSWRAKAPRRELGTLQHWGEIELAEDWHMTDEDLLEA
jgi:prevent-host-death family protein